MVVIVLYLLCYYCCVVRRTKGLFFASVVESTQQNFRNSEVTDRERII